MKNRRGYAQPNNDCQDELAVGHCQRARESEGAEPSQAPKEKVKVIPYMHTATFKCSTCGDTKFYDKTIMRRQPRVCDTCKLSGNAKRELARREKLKAQTAEISGYDLNKYAVMTHQEVADELNISYEAVRRAERSGLAKLRTILKEMNRKAAL